MSDELRADPAEISHYAAELPLLMTNPVLDVQAALARIMPATFDAFRGRDSDAGAFPEGAMIADAVTGNVDRFQQFLRDVGLGVQVIANAAQLCADAYRATDTRSAESMNLVGFAFARPDATTRPPGLDPSIATQTLRQQREESMVDAQRDPTHPTNQYGSDGYHEAVYADGSVITRVDTSAPSQDGRDTVYTTVTTVRGPDGQPVAEKTERVLTRADRSRVETVIEGGVITTTSTAADGSVRIEITSGGQTTTRELPAPAAQPATPPPDPAGPVQDAVQQLGLDNARRP
ncbi:hypothetical protein [Frankia sp. QA3]|uniref:hypothetical protein n=1 Tax=Frankia sp. QA3 TaxID=710111 RepID=UPI000269BBFD|nr:hypothetical protein [Frankia sp. QA3]EIV92652.1 hypothetical protein FraQA3DRAFT_2245 [Frankia sp. QA3]